MRSGAPKPRGRQRGAGRHPHLRLLGPESRLSLHFTLPEKPRVATLEAVHLASAGAEGEGVAPVTVSVNGRAVVRDWNVGATTFTETRWPVGDLLRPGENEIDWTAGEIRTHQPPPMIRYAESFRLHWAMAEFLRQEVYRHDGIGYHSKRRDVPAVHPIEADLIAAVLHPDYPLVVVVHDEAGSQVRNPFEQALIEPILRTLADPSRYGLDAVEGMGVVVPHRTQRAALQQALPELSILDPASGLPVRSAIDTVERFQGGERTVILVSATESGRAYLLASSKFLLDPRRLTVALSRAKRKMILVASRSIFSAFSPDEGVFINLQLWKNLLMKTCTTPLWEGDRGGIRVAAWGGAGRTAEGIGPRHRPNEDRDDLSAVNLT